MFFFFFSSRRRHTRSKRDWSSDVCSSDLRSRRRMKQQAFLQRREREKLLKLWVLPLQPLDLGLREAEQGQIGRGTPPGARLGDVVDQGLEHATPALRQVAHQFLAEQRQSPGPCHTE